MSNKVDLNCTVFKDENAILEDGGRGAPPPKMENRRRES